MRVPRDLPTDMPYSALRILCVPSPELLHQGRSVPLQPRESGTERLIPLPYVASEAGYEA